MSGLDVIDGVDNKVKTGPEVIIEDIFIFRSHSQLKGIEFSFSVNRLAHSASSFAFVFAHMLSPEQKLSVQVADFDIVVVGDRHLARFGGETHQSEHFYELATQGTSSDNERTRLLSLFNKRVTEDNVVVVVAVISDSTSHPFFWESLEEFVVQPLLERSELSSQFHNFLGDDSTPEGANRRNLSISIESHMLNKLLINCLNFEVFTFNVHFGALVFLDQSLELICIILIEDERKTLVLSLEGKQSVEDDMELFRNSELFPAGDGHFLAFRRVGISETLFQIKKFGESWSFDLSSDTSIDVGTESSGISN